MRCFQAGCIGSFGEFLEFVGCLMIFPECSNVAAALSASNACFVRNGFQLASSSSSSSSVVKISLI